MSRTRRIRELSTEAKIGKMLILVGIILEAVGIAAAFTIGLWAGGMMPWSGSMLGLNYGMMGGLFGGVMAVLGLIQLIGLIAGIYAYKAAQENDFQRAGILGIVSSVLPPFQLITLIGSILCLASREAKK